MNTTTTIDLDRLEALAKAATPGPWRASQNDVFAGPRYRIAQGVTAGGSSKSMADERKWQLGNAAFIAAANPAAILELIQLARRSNAGEAAAREQQEPVADSCPECDHEDWRDFYTGPSKTHDVCATCNYRRLAAPVAQQSEAGTDWFVKVPVEQAARYDVLFRAIGDAARIQGNALAISVEQFDATLSKYGYTLSQPTEAGAPTAAATPLPKGWKKAGERILIADFPGMLANCVGGTREYREESLKLLAATIEAALEEAFKEGRESAAPAAPVREGDRELDAKRLDVFIDWYLRDGKRSEIHPDGAIRITTREHILAWLDRAAMQKGASNG